MKVFPALFLMFAATTLGSAADHVWLTIYDQNYAVVRDVRSFTLVEGVNDVSFPDISRMILDAPVRVSGRGIIARDQTFLYHRLNNDFLLQEQFGKKIELILKDSLKTVISGTLVGQPRGSNSYLIQEAEGRVRTVQVSDVHDYRYPGLLAEYQIKPALTFKIESASAGTHDVEAAYEVQGLDWDARYLLDLSGDDSSAVFSGWAVIKNAAGHAFDHARVTLVSGQAPRSQRRLRVTTDERIESAHARGGRSQEVLRDVSSKSVRFSDQPMAMSEQAMTYTAPQHEQLFDLQTYTLPYETDLADGVEKEMNLFVPAKIKTSTSYEYAHWQSPNRVGVYVLTINSDSVGLGVPIPAGQVEIYRMRSGNVPEFVAEDRLGAVAENDPIRFRVGYAEGLSVERKNLKHEGDSRVTDQWEVKIKNDRDTEVAVTIQEGFSSKKWKVLTSSHPYNQVSKNFIEFPVTVPPESEVVVTYEVRTWKTWEGKR